MSCISSNFSSFFLNSLNDPSEFAKYLSNGELKFSSFEDFQVFGTGSQSQSIQQPQQYSSHPPQQQQLNSSSLYYHNTGGSNTISVAATNGTSSGGIAVTAGGTPSSGDIFNGGIHIEPNSYTTPHPTVHHTQQQPAAPPQLHTHSHGHPSLHHHQPQQQQQQQQQQQHHHHPPHAHHPPLFGHNSGQQTQTPSSAGAAFHHHSNHGLAAHHTLPTGPTSNSQQSPYPAQRPWPISAGASGGGGGNLMHNNHPNSPSVHAGGAQHFDGSFEFLKYLRHSNEYSEGTAATSTGTNAGVNGDTANNASGANPILTQQQQAASLIDLDSSTSHKSRSSRKAAALLSSVSRTSNSLDSSALDVFDHDSKHTIFDLHHITNSSNSNESSVEISNLAFPNSHLNASNSNTSSEGAAAGSSDFSLMNSANSAPKPLAAFTIKENFEVHPSHKVEEGIFQHMNKLPPKKKENLKQLGVRFTGQMTLADKSIIVENFIKFCQEYDIKDHRPFLSLNQSGLNKPEQIKFARFLGQGLPTFTLFCIYSNFKNLFCTKRTEIYTKDGYNLPYILDKTKRFLSNTTAGNPPSKQAHSAVSNPPTTPQPQCTQPQQSMSTPPPQTSAPPMPATMDQTA